MWWIIIIIAIFIFSKYNSDKTSLRNSVIHRGGMDVVFSDFIFCIQEVFFESKILKMTEVELEILTISSDEKVFVFGIKQGFSGIVSYRCDTKRSNNINADVVVQGNISNQKESYQMILAELKRKFDLHLLTD